MVGQGSLARVGTYTIVVQAITSGGPTATVRRSVQLASTWQAKRVSKYRSGYAISSRSRSSLCYVNRYYYDETAELDCWGGRYALVNYRFSVPANAYNVDWRLAGMRVAATGDGSPRAVLASPPRQGASQTHVLAQLHRRRRPPELHLQEAHLIAA